MREPVYSYHANDRHVLLELPIDYFEPKRAKRSWDCKHPRLDKNDKLYQTTGQLGHKKYILYYHNHNKYYKIYGDDARVWLMLNGYDADAPAQ